MKKEKLIVVGSSSSGKDYLAKYISDKGLKREIKVTTRPIREGEVNGYTYNYTTSELFEKMIKENSLHEYEKFTTTTGVWYYGSLREQFDSSQVFIKTVGGIKQMSKEDRSKCFVVYLDIDRDILVERLTKRNDTNDSIQRRLDADAIDFSNFTDYDLKITDPEFDPEIVWDLMD